MKNNSDTFLDSFTDIERHLRSLGNANRSTSFYQLVDTAARNDRVVARYSSDLKEYADLRNAIVHERSDGHVIAEPNDRAVADLSQLSTLLLNPPKVLPMFQTRVETRETSSPIGEAVQVMYRQSFS
jgi:predicted nuclease of predicted toxin-antitoxin system